jgi:hypothetical protein
MDADHCPDAVIHARYADDLIALPGRHPVWFNATSK